MVVDDHPLLREGLARLVQSALGVARVREAGNRVEALARARAEAPDLVVLDVVLPDGNGLDLVRDLRAEFPAVRLVVVSSYSDGDYAGRALGAGAQAYVCKDRPPAELAEVLRAVWAGQPVAPARLAVVDVSPVALLTEREMSVFQLLGRGRATREIAVMLGISFKTVEAHRENIKAKLGLGNSVALVQRATLWVSSGR